MNNRSQSFEFLACLSRENWGESTIRDRVVGTISLTVITFLWAASRGVKPRHLEKCPIFILHIHNVLHSSTHSPRRGDSRLDSRLQYQWFRVHNQSDQPTGLYTCSKINQWSQIFAFGHIEFCSNFDLKRGRLELISSYRLSLSFKLFSNQEFVLVFSRPGSSLHPRKTLLKALW